MTTSANNIHNIDTLEKEIYRLQLQAGELEKRMDSHVEYFQQHYATIIKNSIFPGKNEKGSVVAGILNAFVHNERLRKGLDKIGDHLADKASESIDVLVEKMFRKS